MISSVYPRLSRSRSRGASFWQVILLMVVVGFFVDVAITLTPLYMTNMTITSIARQVARDAGHGDYVNVSAINNRLRSDWNLNNIEQPSWRVVQVKRSDSGTELAWSYERRAHLLYNIDVVVSFSGSQPLR